MQIKKRRKAAVKDLFEMPTADKIEKMVYK
jgi:hypothetical protein